VSIAAKKDGKIVEPGDHALELHTIDQKDGYGRLVLPDVIQEHVLKILPLGCGHCSGPVRSVVVGMHGLGRCPP
jgi:hypothetical protein